MSEPRWPHGFDHPACFVCGNGVDIRDAAGHTAKPAHARCVGGPDCVFCGEPTARDGDVTLAGGDLDGAPAHASCSVVYPIRLGRAACGDGAVRRDPGGGRGRGVSARRVRPHRWVPCQDGRSSEARRGYSVETCELCDWWRRATGIGGSFTFARSSAGPWRSYAVVPPCGGPPCPTCGGLGYVQEADRAR